MSEFVKVATLQDIPNYTVKKFSINGIDLILVNSNNTIYAAGSACSHEMGPLEDGDLQGTTLMCPLHGAVFDLNNGEPQTPPAFENIKVYEVEVQGENILVKLG